MENNIHSLVSFISLWLHNTLQRTKRQKAWLKRKSPQLKCIKWSDLKDECLMTSQVGTTIHVSFPSIFCNMCEGQDFSSVAWCLMFRLKHADLFYSPHLLQSYFMMSCECCSIEILKASSILNIAFIDKCVLPLPLQLKQN